ncbi:MAG: xanthine dehydrogenase family protein molybdopterin-binding subunit [Dehalococcoidia bacterium]|nr:xanthine dehydrogenase family protein molybdopterin-binding subunit [Dehalococcoidia bacterium]
METLVLGKSVARFDVREKALGAAQYIDDLVLPGMLWGKILRSTLPHARILRIDTSRAERLPGVAAVITAADVPDAKHGPYIKDLPILARSKVRFVGEPVAAVAAVDEVTAREALELIEVEYDPLPAVFDSLEAMELGAPIIHEELESYLKVFPARFGGNICSHTTIERGDVEKGFGQCDRVFEDVFHTPEVHQASLETHGALASFDASGRVTVWTSTQSIYRTATSIHETLGLPITKIRVISEHVGGAFGGKVEPLVQPVCVALARKARRPVKIILSREEELAVTKPRHPSRVELKTGVMKDGTLLARQARIVFDAGAYADDGPGITCVGALLCQGAYRVPNLRMDGYCVYTNKTHTGAYRGFGNPQVTFAVESQMDIIASDLGLDPLQFRLHNALENGDLNAAGQPLVAVGVKQCLRRAAEAMGWGGTARQAGPNRGRGLSLLVHCSGVLTSGATVGLNEDGTVVARVAVAEIGNGGVTAMGQIVAEELGVTAEEVAIVYADTDATPYNWATCASRTVFTVGNTVKLAAADAKAEIVDLAAEMLEANAQDLEVRGGRVFVKGSPDRGLSFREMALIANWSKKGPIIGKGSYKAEGPPVQATMEGSPFHSMSGFVYGAHAIEVEVDRDTGKVRVLKAACAHDVGKAVNPLAVEGQIEGGFAQGEGFALYEAIVRDGGKVCNPTFMDYKLPTSMDVPRVTPIIVEVPDPDGPFGAKGVGEPGLVNVAPAIANAIYDAVGVRIYQLPITPFAVLKALKEKRGTDEGSG